MNKKDISFFDDQPIFILDYNSHDILDANNSAVELYGYSRDELCEMNLSDLGGKTQRYELLGNQENGSSSRDDIWVHESKEGDKLFIQFTSHVFSYQGSPVTLAVAHDVASQIEKKEERRTKYPKIFAYQGSSPLAKITWDSDLTVRNWSEKAEELLGWSKGEVIGKGDFFKKLVYPEELEIARNKIETAAKEHKSSYTSEGKVVTKNGEVLNSKWYNSLIYDGDGNLSSVQSLITDVSRHKESQELFRTLSEKTLVGVFLIQDNHFLHVNPRFADIFGYEQQEIIDDVTPFDLIHPNDRSSLKRNIVEETNGNPLDNEYEIKGITKEGREIDMNLYGSKIKYRGDDAIVGTLIDITKNKEVMRNYRASLETFQDLFDSISDAIYIQDEEGRFLEVNQGAVDMYGYEESFYIGKTPEVLAAPGKVDLVKTQNHIQKALNGTPQSFKWWGKRKDGEIFPKEVVANPGTYFGEDVVITIARDISYRYNAEEELRKNEEMFRQLFQNAPISIALMDKNQEVRKVNTSFQETFGFSTEEIKGKNIDTVIVPEQERKTAEGISEEIFQGEAAFHTGKRVHKDGSLLDVLIYGVPVNVDDNTIAIYGIYVDITDRKEAEEKVKKSLKEKEVLLSEIHHRVKNNLAVITGLLELQAYNTESADASHVLKASQMRVNSIGLIHEKLYQNENLSEISFGEYLEELVDEILASVDDEPVDVSVTIDADPINMTIGQAIPCGLILNETITNAYKHAFIDQEEGNIKVSIHLDGENIVLSVEDDGSGMPENVGLDKGQSLGFQLINTLSTQIDAEVWFDEKRETGSRFMLEFELEKDVDFSSAR
ncbi:PAS domain S-box-containing protein [Fodinibius salinus]|uniref:PAS domain S-box-containing protein n=1 Tax=Fodinibius salinus TaxID=860790 RepID=A0A5D3YMR7_9BACT|nr:PAS domain S-box protein [Fodinibius salinus]TYP95406.1 PAS domain S-box-containing protein [Fodinibius salinus]